MKLVIFLLDYPNLKPQENSFQIQTRFFWLQSNIQWFGHFSQNKLHEFHKLFKNNSLYFYKQFRKLL